MAKHGENIYKRKDGRWEARVIKGYDVNGKALYSYVYGRTYREAKEKIFMPLSYNAHTPELTNTIDMPQFEDVLNSWLAGKKVGIRFCRTNTILPHTRSTKNWRTTIHRIRSISSST